MFRIIKLLFTWLAIFLVFILVIELVLRMIGFDHGMSLIIKDPVFHHTHRKNYTFKTESIENEESGKHPVTYDRYGRRISENPETKNSDKEIWFFGDSFTASYELSWNNTYVGKVDNQTDLKIINYGVPSYSPMLYLMQLNQILRNDSHKPELIFIQLYNNDVIDDSDYEKVAEFDSNDIPIKCDGGSRLVYDIASRMAIAKLTLKSLLNLKNVITGGDNISDTITNPVVAYELAPTINPEKRFIMSIWHIHILLDSLEIPYLFFAIPSKYATLTGDWTANTFTTQVNRFLDENGLLFVNGLDSAFRSYPDSERLFYKSDIHCTIEGNELIAKELLKIINSI